MTTRACGEAAQKKIVRERNEGRKIIIFFHNKLFVSLQGKKVSFYYIYDVSSL